MANQTKRDSTTKKSNASSAKSAKQSTTKSAAANKSSTTKQTKTAAHQSKQKGPNQKASATTHKSSEGTKAKGTQESKKSHAHEKGGSEDKQATQQHKDDASPKQFKTIGIIIGVLVVIALLIFLGQSGILGGNQNMTAPTTGNGAETSEGTVVMTINGEEVTQAQYDQVANQMSRGSQGAPNESAVMEQVISQTLLLQEANRRGLSVTREEAEQQLQQSLAQQGVNQSQLRQMLAQEGLNYEEFISQYRQQQVISNLQSSLTENVTVSDQEARSFFENNRAVFTSRYGSNVSFTDVEQTVVSYLQQQQAQQQIQTLLEELRSDAEIVQE